jgi:hypothetical protein
MMKLLLLTLPFVSGFMPTTMPLVGRKRPISKTQHSAVAIEGVAETIDTFFQTKPFMSAFLTCSVKASSADMLAQLRQMAPKVNGDDESAIDYQRTLGFLVYGGIYQGCFQELLFGVLFPAWFGNDQSWQTVAAQVGLDAAFIAPFLCLPFAYIFKAAFTADELSMDVVKEFLEKYVDDVKHRGLLLKYWAVWIPVQTLTFSVVPHHFRIAFIAFVSFFWTGILSSVSAAQNQDSKAAVTE